MEKNYKIRETYLKEPKISLDFSKVFNSVSCFLFGKPKDYNPV